MSRQFNKDHFEVVIKIVHAFLRFSVVALYVLIALIATGWIITWFIPQASFDFDLANLGNTNVQVFGLQYDLESLGLTGVVNVKRIVVLALLAIIGNLAFYQYIQVLLKRIMTHIRNEHPFNDANVTYLKWMGIGFLVASVALPIINSFFFSSVVNTLELFEANVSLSPNMQAIFMGVIILIVGYIFDYGTYLQEEHDMTV